MIQVIIPETVEQSLLDLQKQTKAESLRDVIKDAITLYAAVVHHHQAGRKVYVQGDVGRRIPLLVTEPR